MILGNSLLQKVSSAIQTAIYRGERAIFICDTLRASITLPVFYDTQLKLVIGDFFSRQFLLFHFVERKVLKIRPITRDTN